MKLRFGSPALLMLLLHTPVALDSALVVLNAEQKTIAASLLTAHSADVDEMLREKTGGR